MAVRSIGSSSGEGGFVERWHPEAAVRCTSRTHASQGSWSSGPTRVAFSGSTKIEPQIGVLCQDLDELDAD